MIPCLVTVVGAGLTGAMLSALLAKVGRSVRLIEGHLDPRRHATVDYPSINLALSYRGLKALDRLGVCDEIWPLLVPMRGRQIHTAESQEFQAYDLVGARSLYSVRRSDLMRLLLDTAEACGAQTIFGLSLKAIDAPCRTMRLVDKASGAERTESFEMLIGTDGCHSVVRRGLDTAWGESSAVSELAHGYRELPIDQASPLASSLRQDALHVWPRHDFMMVALPNANRSFTATLFMPHEGHESFSHLSNTAAVKKLFDRHFQDIGGSCSWAVPALTRRPIGRLITAEARHWSFGGAVAILGDAAHALPPFLGQGMNCAFEDCVCLADLLDEHRGNPADTFSRFEELRRPNAQAIAHMSLENYLEMRHTVTQSEHRATRRMMQQLQERFPMKFVPLYSMVSFSDVPYTDALARHRVQETILGALFGQGNSDVIDWPLATRLIKEGLRSDVLLSPESFYRHRGAFQPNLPSC